MVVIVVAVCLDLEQVPIGFLVLLDGAVPGNLELRGVEVDSLLGEVESEKFESVSVLADGDPDPDDADQNHWFKTK